MLPEKQLREYITSLSDAELYKKLQEYGTTVGPILPSTRRVYELRLYKLETGQVAAPVDQVDETDEFDQNDNNDQEVPEQAPIVQQQTRHRPTAHFRVEEQKREIQIGKPTPRRPLHPGMGDGSPRRSAYSKNSQSSATRPQSSSTSAKGGLPLWVKLMTVLVFVGLVYLVIKNMEFAPANSLPGQIETEV